MHIKKKTTGDYFVRSEDALHPGHCWRVAAMTAMVYEDLPPLLYAQGFSDLASKIAHLQFVNLVRLALYHDIGKIEMAQFYSEERIFSREDRARLKDHCQAGYEIARQRPGFSPVALLIYYHHEHWNGSGYFGLEKEAVPLECRLFTVLDTYDVIRRGRAYCRPNSHAMTKKIILTDAGKQFDPVLAPAVLKVLEKNTN